MKMKYTGKGKERQENRRIGRRMGSKRADEDDEPSKAQWLLYVPPASAY
jgi:hypothetical protein